MLKTADSKRLLPDGVHLKTGCGDIWVVTNGVIYVLNNIESYAVRFPSCATYAIDTVVEKTIYTFYFEYLHNEGFLTLPMCDKYDSLLRKGYTYR